MMTKRSDRLSESRQDHWPLQDAKARLSELVRRVKSDGPQHVTIHGRDEVVVISAEEYRRLSGAVTGQGLIDVFQSSPFHWGKNARSLGLIPPSDAS